MTELITTGVDRLVQLVMQKKRVGIDEAAKELSVPKVLIEEWADFLEEREVIGIDYKFAKPFLVYKEMSKDETAELAKKFEGRKEGFVRKVDSVLQCLDQETEGLNHMKAEFGSMTNELESKLSHVKNELQMLSEYEQMKKEVDSRIASEDKKFSERRQKLTQQIESNKQAISRYIQSVEKTEKQLTSEEKFAKQMVEKEALLEKKMQEQALAFQRKIESDKGKVSGVVQKICSLTELSKQLEADFQNQSRSIEPLLNESKKYEQRAMEMKKRFFDKFATTSKNIGSDLTMAEISRIKQGFVKVFAKKEAAEKLLGKVNSDLEDLKKEFRELSKEALIIKLKSKSKKVADYVSEFEEKYKTLEEKKARFGKEVSTLSNIFKDL